MKKFKFRFSKTAQACLLALLMVPLFSTCKKDDKPEAPPEVPKSNATLMEKFNISVADGPTFSAELLEDGVTFEFLAPLQYPAGELFEQARLNGATASFTLSKGATSDPASGTSADFTKDVSYTVTAEDGTTTKVYTVKKRDGTSDEAEIKSFELVVAGVRYPGIITPDGDDFKITFEDKFPYDMEEDLVANAVPDFTMSVGATANPQTDTEDLDFTEPVEIIVTAHDGTTTKKYTVVTELGSSIKTEVLSFSLTIGEEEFEGIIDEEEFKITIGKEIKVDVWGTYSYPFVFPYELRTSLNGAIATFTLSNGATTSFQSGVANEFSDPFEFTVTAQDGVTTQKWTMELQAPMQANIEYYYLHFYEGAQPPAPFVGGDFRIQSHETEELPRHGVINIDAENGLITYDLPLMPDWFTADKMKNIFALVDVNWGIYESMSPGPDDPQDFTQDVVYTLYAQDGTPKTWTVKAPSCYAKKRWEMDYKKEIGNDEAPTSIAIIGDYLSVARTTLLFNKSNGEKVEGKTLDCTGWENWNSASQVWPFFVTNDDAGNMLGINLSNWRPDQVTVTKWTSYDSPPVPVLEFPSTDVGTFGRKLQVLGDINSNALIISSDAAKTSGEPNYVATAGWHYTWKLNGGELVSHQAVETGFRQQGNAYQILTPLGLEPVAPFYISTPVVSEGPSGSTTTVSYPILHLGGKDNLVEIKGPYNGTTDANGWGNLNYHYHKLFDLDGKKMFANLTSNYSQIYFTVMERNADNTLNTDNLVISDIIPWSTADYINTNGTGSFTLEKVGNDIFFYVFVTNRGIFSYQLSKL